MSVVYCHWCDKHVDTDVDVEHFITDKYPEGNEEFCVEEEEHWVSVEGGGGKYIKLLEERDTLKAERDAFQKAFNLVMDELFEGGNHDQQEYLDKELKKLGL